MGRYIGHRKLCTNPDESLFWRDEYEAIVQSYPVEEQERVRIDLMNGLNSEEYGVKIPVLMCKCDDFSRFSSRNRCNRSN